jgi:hypothetical protein
MQIRCSFFIAETVLAKPHRAHDSVQAFALRIQIPRQTSQSKGVPEVMEWLNSE